MEHLHRYRTHIYFFISGLALAALYIAIFCYFYNPVIAEVTQASVGAVASDPSTWKGVNLPLLLSSENPSAPTKNLLNFDPAAYAGANVIRLYVHADPTSSNYTVHFFDSNGNVSANAQGFADLQTAVAMAAKDNLKVIIDMHPAPGEGDGSIWTSQTDWDNLVQIWTIIAGEFKDNPTVIGFDLINEPNLLSSLSATTTPTLAATQGAMLRGTWTLPTAWQQTPRDYIWEITKVAQAIRAVDPNRTLIVQSYGDQGNPVNFNWMTPLPLNNVVYSAHIYNPAGLTLATTTATPFVLGPSSVLNVALGWVRSFQEKYNLPDNAIYIGEFGSENPGIFGPSSNSSPINGACWMTTIMSDMDAYHWGWTYWAFSSPFIPVSMNDPRYVALSSDMKTGTIPDFCNNPPTLDATVGSLIPITPPIITLNGATNMTLTVGDSFTDPGFSASDAVDGNITSKVTVTGSVDTNTAGTYELTYTVTDSSGGAATAARTIIVNPVVSEIDTGTGQTSGGGGNVSGGGSAYTLTTSNTDVPGAPVTTVSQPIATVPVSKMLQFHVATPTPVPVTAVTAQTKTVATQTVDADPLTASVKQTLANLKPGSTTIVSVTYTLDGTVIHTTTSFPDNWNLDTTTASNGVHTLTAVYQYADGSTRNSITIFTIQNGQTFIDSIDGVFQGIWEALKNVIQHW